MRVLLVQTSFLGDTILSTPVISGLKKIYPHAELWMMTTPPASALIKRDPLLTGVLVYDKRGKGAGIKGFLKMRRTIKSMGFEKVYALHRSYRTAMLLWLCGIPMRVGFSDAKLSFLYHQVRRRNPADHDVVRNLSLLTVELPLESLNTELRLFPPKKREIDEEIENVLPPPGTYVVLVPGSVWKTKMWHWEGYREVADYILKKGCEVVLLGAHSDGLVNAKVAQGLNAIDLAGKTSISAAMYTIKNSKLVVCNDSMALHFASAFKVPNVAIFCATSPKFGFHPWKNKAVVVEKQNLACKPCARHGGQTCPTGTEVCMKEVSAAEVIAAVEKLLGLTKKVQPESEHLEG